MSVNKFLPALQLFLNYLKLHGKYVYITQ